MECLPPSWAWNFCNYGRVSSREGPRAQPEIESLDAVLSTHCWKDRALKCEPLRGSWELAWVFRSHRGHLVSLTANRCQDNLLSHKGQASIKRPSALVSVFLTTWCEGGHGVPNLQLWRRRRADRSSGQSGMPALLNSFIFLLFPAESCLSQLVHPDSRSPALGLSAQNLRAE